MSGGSSATFTANGVMFYNGGNRETSARDGQQGGTVDASPPTSGPGRYLDLSRPASATTWRLSGAAGTSPAPSTRPGSSRHTGGARANMGSQFVADTMTLSRRTFAISIRERIRGSGYPTRG